ncbi:MAG: hypothetical protein GX748_18635, partial [Lentisphaerae bacterium]|nr:hypothetical protein [Lentisphaerota bacterium]
MMNAYALRNGIVRVAGCVAGFFCALNAWGQADVPRFYTATSNDALTGAAPIVKTGAGTLWLTSPSNNTFTGDITVGVDGGTLRIGGNTFYAAGTGRTGTTLPAMGAASTITVKRGGIFQINDNLNGAAGRIDNRLGSEGDRPAVSLEGGTFYFYGINATQQTTQSVGQVTLASGTSVINVNRTHATSTPKLIGAGLAVTPGAYASFVGTTPGAAAANVSQFYFTTPPSTVGGGGAFGSPTVSIVPATRIGNDFVAYGLYGIRALLATEYKATSDINTAGDTENVKFTTGTLSALAGNKTVNSLA